MFSMKGLNNVRKGIYSLDGFQIYPAEEFGIIVHPFYDLYGRNSYLKNLYNFLNAFEGNVLTLEEDCSINKTVGRYRRNLHAFNNFFVKTNSIPEPTEIEWNDIKRFIKRFKPKRLKAAGGYYAYQKYLGRHGGCLGDTIDILKEDFKNIEVVESCTF